MEELTRQKDAEREYAATPFGLNPGFLRLFQDQVEATGRERDMQDWPVQAGGRPMQDPVTGALYFIPGISSPGGPDIIF